MRSKGLVIGVAAVGLAGFIALVTYLSFPKPEDLEWRHVARVLLRGEIQYRTPVIERWVGPLDVVVIGGGTADRTTIQSLAEDINILIAGSDVQLSIKEDKGIGIVVGFVPYERFPVIAESLKFRYEPGNTGYFQVFGNNMPIVDTALVLVADELAGTLRKHVILEEIYQAMGLFNDSPLFPDSIIYEENGISGGVIEISDLDRKLIRFLYLHLKPGDDLAALRRAYDRHWRTMTVPPRLKK